MNLPAPPSTGALSTGQADAVPDSGPLQVPPPAAAFLGPHHLVHRPDTPEGFLHSATPPGRHRFGFSAQLPDDHPLFADSTAPFHDVLYPMESLRQMAVFAAGRYFRVPENRRILLADCAFSLTALSCWQRDGLAGARLSLDLDLTPADVVKGVPRSMECGATISIDDEPCGTVRARLVFLLPGVYRKHRAHSRRESERTAGGNSGLPAGHSVPGAELVGRRHARNVLIGLPLEEDGTSLTFPVNIPAAREVLPDAGSEVPSALFLEVSRQAALFGVGELYGLAPGHAVLTRWEATFRGFAEPGLPLLCSVQPRHPSAPGEVARDSAGRPLAELTLVFTQGIRVVAEMTACVLQIC
ncbi:AfsA-related hotdog domain-containing protein [Streptomyces indicus]|uniref:A-factor biosynthesis hotdog domain-containing protein n=1 Tax=Streptomyces indicus TaxID=417292 RepID=A0A1G9J3D3_9ACTN|nr:AfsA-related hotdog domain-containing protein [Streptomyces indicus]SDL31841.1 A-factor biosynthesis hotdog domain-containing protein [Streptomyces indicus]